MCKSFETGLSTFYYLMICADGIIDDRELQLGEIMIKHERIKKNKFYNRIEECGHWDKKNLFDECIMFLKKCSKKAQIKTVAWMSLVAKIDGFVSPKEEQLLNIISLKELKLELDSVLKEENRLIKSCKLELALAKQEHISRY